MLFCSLSNRHAFSLVDVKTGQKQTNVVNMNKRRRSNDMHLYSSSFASPFPVSIALFFFIEISLFPRCLTAFRLSLFSLSLSSLLSLLFPSGVRYQQVES